MRRPKYIRNGGKWQLDRFLEAIGYFKFMSDNLPSELSKARTELDLGLVLKRLSDSILMGHKNVNGFRTLIRAFHEKSPNLEDYMLNMSLSSITITEGQMIELTCYDGIHLSKIARESLKILWLDGGFHEALTVDMVPTQTLLKTGKVRTTIGFINGLPIYVHNNLEGISVYTNTKHMLSMMLEHVLKIGSKALYLRADESYYNVAAITYAKRFGYSYFISTPPRFFKTKFRSVEEWTLELIDGVQGVVGSFNWTAFGITHHYVVQCRNGDLMDIERYLCICTNCRTMTDVEIIEFYLSRSKQEHALSALTDDFDWGGLNYKTLVETGIHQYLTILVNLIFISIKGLKAGKFSNLRLDDSLKDFRVKYLKRPARLRSSNQNPR